MKKNPSVIKELKREERDEYPLLVLREAIINSLVHRNYSINRVLGFGVRVFTPKLRNRYPGV